MYYEINVSQEGQHVFATAERSAPTISKAKYLYEMFSKAFPAELGYKIDVYCWETTGRTLKESELR